MLKAWLNMWRNIFNYKGSASRKEYWLAIIMNVIAMYVGVIPCALLAALFADNVTAFITVYLIAVHLPVISLYFRRARGAGWKLGTTVYLAITIPVLSGLLVGAIFHCGAVTAKALAMSFALFFYGGMLGLALYGDPGAIPFLPIAGLLLGTLTLIVYGIVSWRQVLAFWAGTSDS